MLNRAHVVLLALLALPTAASAEDVLRHAWGRTNRPAGPNVLTVTPCPDPSCFAVLEFRNTLISDMPHRGSTTVTLTIDGLDVVAVIAHRAGRQVETLSVQPPYGFIAEPPVLDVGEDAMGTVRLVAMLVG